MLSAVYASQWFVEAYFTADKQHHRFFSFLKNIPLIFCYSILNCNLNVDLFKLQLTHKLLHV